MSITSKSPEPWLLGFRSSETFILTVICISIMTDLFIYSMIVPILPDTLISRAGVPEENVQSWISVLLAAYGGFLMLGSPIFGYFADQYQSRKIPFILGLAALGLSTIFFMFSVSPYLLLVARSLQGISAAAVFVVGFAMVADNVEKERIAQSMGYASVAMTVGNLLGPAIGGITYDKLSYYGVFILPITLVVLDILMRFAMIEKSVARQWQQDLPGNVNTAVSNYDTVPNHSERTTPSSRPELTSERSPLLSSSISSPDSWTATRKHTGGSDAGVFFLLRTTRLPLTLLNIVVIVALVPAFETTLPLFVRRTFHWSPSGAGIVFLAIAIPSLAGGLVGKVVDRVGTRYPCCIGFAVASIAIICLRFVEKNGMAEKVILVGLLMLMSFAITLVQVSAMAEVFLVVKETEKHQPGVFGGKSPIARVYAVLSVAAATSHLGSPLLAGLVQEHAGWKTMTLSLGLLCVVMTITAGFFGGASSPYARKTAAEEEA